MTFKDFKSGLDLMGNTISDVAAVLSEKNKLRAQCSRIKQIIRHDTAERDNAYIELGRYYYEHFRDENVPGLEDSFKTIERMNNRIEKASLKYIQLQDAQNNLKIQSENAEKLKAVLTSKSEQSEDTAQETVKEAEYTAEKSVIETEEIINNTEIKTKSVYDTTDIEKAIEIINRENETKAEHDPADVKQPSDIAAEIKIEVETVKVIEEKPVLNSQNIQNPVNEKICEEESPETFDFGD